MNRKNSDAVYVALVEVVPLADCELSPDDIGGAAVRCYVKAPTAEAAIEKIIETLQQHRLELMQVEWCVGEADVEWEFPDDPVGAALTLEARTSDDVVFGEFHCWPAE